MLLFLFCFLNLQLTITFTTNTEAESIARLIYELEQQRSQGCVNMRFFFREDGLRGLSSDINYQVGDVILTIPSTTFISKESILRNQQNFSSGQYQLLTNQSLAIVFSYYRALTLSQQSAYSSLNEIYLGLLPTSYDHHPLMMNKGLIEESQDKELINQIHQAQVIFQDTITETLSFLDLNQTVDQMQSMFVNIINQSQQAIAIGILSVYTRNFVPQQLTSRKSPLFNSEEQYLIPLGGINLHYKDFINDGQDTNCKWYFDDNKTFIVEATKFIRSGQELIYSYGSLSKRRQLLDYGYFDPLNPDMEISVQFCIDQNDPLNEEKLMYVRHHNAGCKYFTFNNKTNEEQKNQFIDVLGQLRFLIMRDSNQFHDLLDDLQRQYSKDASVVLEPYDALEEIELLKWILDVLRKTLEEYPTQLTHDVEERAMEQDKIRQLIIDYRIESKTFLMELINEFQFLHNLYKLPKPKQQRRISKLPLYHPYRDKLGGYLEVISMLIH